AQFTPFLIPIGGPLRPAHRGRVLFAGDAGGFVNAITAEGIYYAMVSGELADRAPATTNGDALGPGPLYQRMWRKEHGTELADAVLFQRYLFPSHERVARLVRSAAAAPAMVDLLVSYVMGAISYGTLRRRVFMK